MAKKDALTPEQEALKQSFDCTVKLLKLRKDQYREFSNNTLVPVLNKKKLLLDSISTLTQMLQLDREQGLLLNIILDANAGAQAHENKMQELTFAEKEAKEETPISSAPKEIYRKRRRPLVGEPYKEVHKKRIKQLIRSNIRNPEMAWFTILAVARLYQKEFPDTGLREAGMRNYAGAAIHEMLAEKNPIIKQLKYPYNNILHRMYTIPAQTYMFAPAHIDLPEVIKDWRNKQEQIVEYIEKNDIALLKALQDESTEEVQTKPAEKIQPKPAQKVRDIEQGVEKTEKIKPGDTLDGQSFMAYCREKALDSIALMEEGGVVQYFINGNIRKYLTDNYPISDAKGHSLRLAIDQAFRHLVEKKVITKINDIEHARAIRVSAGYSTNAAVYTFTRVEEAKKIPTVVPNSREKHITKAAQKASKRRRGQRKTKKGAPVSREQVVENVKKIVIPLVENLRFVCTRDILLGYEKAFGHKIDTKVPYVAEALAPLLAERKIYKIPPEYVLPTYKEINIHVQSTNVYIMNTQLDIVVSDLRRILGTKKATVSRAKNKITSAIVAHSLKVGSNTKYTMEFTEQRRQAVIDVLNSIEPPIYTNPLVQQLLKKRATSIHSAENMTDKTSYNVLESLIDDGILRLVTLEEKALFKLAGVLPDARLKVYIPTQETPENIISKKPIIVTKNSPVDLKTQYCLHTFNPNIVFNYTQAQKAYEDMFGTLAGKYDRLHFSKTMNTVMKRRIKLGFTKIVKNISGPSNARIKDSARQVLTMHFENTGKPFPAQYTKKRSY